MNRLDQLNKMLEADPKDSFVLFAIAMEYKSNDNLEKAIECFVELKGVDENYVGLYYHLAHCYEELDESEKALDTYKSGITVAEQIKDQHSKSELMNAKMNLELGL